MSNSAIKTVDVAIIGGGLVGSSLALALQKLPIKIALVEPFAPTDAKAPGFDARAIALSRTSAKILNGLSLWEAIGSTATAIEHIHVSDKGRPGLCHFSAAEANIPAMGYVVELEEVAEVIHQAIQGAKIERFCPGQLTAIKALKPQASDNSASTYQLQINQNEQEVLLNAKLVVAADGGRSGILQHLNIEQIEKPYEQAAIISTIKTQKPHQNRAYERFTDEGPVALLPLSDNRISLVWMLPPERAKAMQQTEDSEFIEALQTAFGYRLGRIERIGARHLYPLSLKQTHWQGPGLIFIGNASQSLHPIAGQGFNLGLRDVADLVDAIRQSCLDNQALNSSAFAEHYFQQRQKDRQHIISLTDALARLFANPSLLLSLPRNGLLNLLSLIPTARHEFTRFAMGMQHQASRLTRGLGIDPEARP